MLGKIISVLLGLLLGTAWFVYSQYEKNALISEETEKINSRILEISEKASMEKVSKDVEAIKNELKKALSEKNTVELTVTDSFKAFENLYDSAKKDPEFYDFSKTPKFLESKEFLNLERLKSRTLTTSVKINGNKRIDTVGIPEFLSCEKLGIKSPCSKVSDDTIPFVSEDAVKTVFDEREFSTEEAVAILSGKKNF